MSRRPWSAVTRRVAGRRTVLVRGSGLDRRDLALEAAFCVGPRRLLLRDQAPLVDVLALDAAVPGDALRRLELGRRLVPRPVGGVRNARAAENVRAEADTRHRLDTAGDADVDRAGGDQSGDEVVRLLRRAALASRRSSPRLEREARAQPGVAGDVRGLLAGLGHAAADDLLDLVGVDAGALDDLGLGGGEQLGRVQAGELAVALADRRTDGFDDHGIGHFVPPFTGS